MREIKTCIEGELKIFTIDVVKYVEATATKTYGTDAVGDLSNKNIYVDFYTASPGILSNTAVVEKSKLAGQASTTGITLDTTASTRAYIKIQMQSGDYAAGKILTDGKNPQMYELRVRITSGSTEVENVYPHRNTSREEVEYYIIFYPKRDNA